MHILDVQVGQWVVVVYEINEHPGEVTSISDINGVLTQEGQNEAKE